MNNIDKYKVSKLCNAIEDGIDVGLKQMVETIKTQCYMSQTETDWENCDELEHLDDAWNSFDITLALKSRFKKVIISSLTDSDWISDDEKAKRNPNKFRKSQFETEIDMVGDGREDWDLENIKREDEEDLNVVAQDLMEKLDEIHFTPLQNLSLDEYVAEHYNVLTENERMECYTLLDKFQDADEERMLVSQYASESEELKESEIKSITILALEGLLEQVRDADDTVAIQRVKKVLEKAKKTKLL